MPDQDLPGQLDLFVDGAGTALLHALGEALTVGSPGTARAALERLRTHDPVHPDLGALGRLCEVLEPGLPAPASPRAMAALARDVATVLLPAAQRLLGDAAPLALTPVWRRLVEGAGPPRLDTRGETGIARYWTGVAHYHLGARRPALRLWLSLAWLDPEALATWIPQCPDPSVRSAWLALERAPAFELPEDDAVTRAQWFPAWLLLRDRQVADLFRPDEVPDKEASSAALRQALALLPLEAGGLSDAVIRARRALRAIAPAFFRLYLRTVGR